MSEPDLDRVLVEADPEAGVTTAFTLEPLKDGRQTRVAVATEVTDCPGFRGFVEKLLNPTITRRIFK